MDQIFDAFILAKVKGDNVVCVVKKQLRLEDLSKVGKANQDRGSVFYLNEYKLGAELEAYEVLDMDNFNPTSRYINSLVL